MIPQELQLQARQLIEKAKAILVIPSCPPDGDSLGSATALYLVFKKLGKETTVVCADPVPEVLTFLPSTAEVTKNELHFTRDLIVTLDCPNAEVENVKYDIQPNKVNIIISPKRGLLSRDNVHIDYAKVPYDLIITVDAGDVSQFGKIYEDNTELFHLIPVINIDHHVSNSNFGKLNLVDVMASSATSIVFDMIESMDRRLIDADVATLLLVGVITDTGSFQNPNTTPDSFAIAARLIEYGARQQEIIQHVYKTKKMSTLKLWGRVLSKIQHDEAHRFVWSVISNKDLADTGSILEESEGIIDELMTNAPGCEIAVLLKERADGMIGGSVR
ncbi:MAG: DHH family phosphoesterase, partial [Patescibacteria group bacterium]